MNPLLPNSIQSTRSSVIEHSSIAHPLISIVEKICRLVQTAEATPRDAQVLVSRSSCTLILCFQIPFPRLITILEFALNKRDHKM